MKRHILTAVAVLLVVHLAAPAPAPAQVPMQRGNTISARLFFTGGATDYALGLTFPVNPTLDAAFAYSTIPPFDSAIDLGARLHFPMRTAGVDPYVGAGLTLTSTGGTSNTGLFAQGGIAFSLAQGTTGFVGLHYTTSAGVTVTQYDIGLHHQFAPQVAGLLGFVGSEGSTSVYLGVNVNF